MNAEEAIKFADELLQKYERLKQKFRSLGYPIPDELEKQEREANLMKQEIEWTLHETEWYKRKIEERNKEIEEKDRKLKKLEQEYKSEVRKRDALRYRAIHTSDFSREKVVLLGLHDEMDTRPRPVSTDSRARVVIKDFAIKYRMYESDVEGALKFLVRNEVISRSIEPRVNESTGKVEEVNVIGFSEELCVNPGGVKMLKGEAQIKRLRPSVPFRKKKKR